MAITLRATKVETPPPEKMSPPEFRPTPPLTEPAPYVVPRRYSVEPSQNTKPAVWRMTEAELDEVMPWLWPKLADKWPRLDADKLVYFLKQTMPLRTMLLCRTLNVVGCFYTQQDVFEPMPVAYEKFVRCREGMKRYQGEAEKLYGFARKWATDVKARALRTGDDTDVSMLDPNLKFIVGKQQYHFYVDLTGGKGG